MFDFVKSIYIFSSIIRILPQLNQLIAQPMHPLPLHETTFIVHRGEQ